MLMIGWLPRHVHSLTPKKENGKRSESKLCSHYSLNLEHQGVFERALFPRTGLPQEYWSIDGFEHQGSINLLKGCIQHADKITTVSPTYSAEVKTKQFGHGLEPCLQFRASDLIGILNGIDMDSWNPSKDTTIPHFIDQESPLTGKAICKQYLKNEFNLSSIKESAIIWSCLQALLSKRPGSITSDFERAFGIQYRTIHHSWKWIVRRRG